MADIRINALATTAASTASDDFIAVDGSANGTRKLNAFSPTFGGNLTVSGTGTSTFAGPVTGTSSTNGYQWTLTGSGIGGPSIALDATNATVANRYSGLTLFSGGTFQWGLQLRAGDGKFHIYDGVRTVSALTVDVGPLSGVAGTTTVGGNLTVNGGTIGTAASTNLTLAGGSSGASLVLGQGTNGAPTLAAAGSGTPTITKLGAANGARRVALSLQTGADGTLGPVNIELAAYPSATGSDRYATLSVGDTGAWRPLVLQHANGNVLIGTTTDGGQKLQVAGTGLFSTTEPTITLSSTAAGSIAYQLISGGGSGHTLGAFKIYDSSTGYVVLNHDKPTSGGTRLSFDGAGNATFAGKVFLSKSSSTGCFDIVGGANEKFRMYGGSSAITTTTIGTYTTQEALTITDTSATFSGIIKPQQAATASAPTYVKGAIYFDTTLNKLCVGGATGWETITST